MEEELEREIELDCQCCWCQERKKPLKIKYIVVKVGNKLIYRLEYNGICHDPFYGK